MTPRQHLNGLVSRIQAVHEMLESMSVPHQFGGAIALAWYRNPRATTDIDLNVTVSPSLADPVLGAVGRLGVTVTDPDRRLIKRDGQVRLDWRGSYLDLFFATLEMHFDFARRQRLVDFGPIQIPILAPEHLVVCKAIFDRPKDWVDIQAMIEWGAAIDEEEALRRLDEILGPGSEPRSHLVRLLEGSRA